jgi:ABC-2 type transport system ATP-binding protein
VFVSSHLLSEMALMADQLVVIGRGRLIASGPIQDFVKTSRHNAVLVRSPQAGELADLVRAQGATVEPVEPGLLSVVGLEPQAIGDLAFDASIRLHELAPRVATLEEAFLEATGAAQEFEAHGVSTGSTTRDGEDGSAVSRRSQARSSTTEGVARSSTTDNEEGDA